MVCCLWFVVCGCCRALSLKTNFKPRNKEQQTIDYKLQTVIPVFLFLMYILSPVR